MTTTYKGVKGIQDLQNKVHNQVTNALAEGAKDVGNYLIDNSPIGQASYMSSRGEVYTDNDVGTFKNSWCFSSGSPDSYERSGDVNGVGSKVDALDFSSEFFLGEDIYIINGSYHASAVEKGWDSVTFPERVDFGWSDKEGYEVVKGTPANVIISNSLSDAKGG